MNSAQHHPKEPTTTQESKVDINSLHIKFTVMINRVHLLCLISIIQIFPATVCGQNYESERLTIDEIKILSVYNVIEANNKVDSVLRSKRFITRKSEDGSVVYHNDFGDVFGSGYNEGAKMLITMLVMKEYSYYSYLRKNLLSEFTNFTTGEFLNFDLAEFYDSGMYNIVIGSDSKENVFGVVTRINLEK